MDFVFLKQNAEAFFLMLTFAVLGGASQYIRKVQAKAATFSISELVGETVISASAGLTAGLLLLDHVPLPMVLAASSVAGHMGTRFIFAAESWLTEKIQARFGKPE